MRLARAFTVPETDQCVVNRLRDFMSRLGYHGRGDAEALTFHRGSPRGMLYSLSPWETPCDVVVYVEADDRKTRVSALLNAAVFLPCMEGDLRYFEAELDGLEAAAWGNASAMNEVLAAERAARSPGKRTLKIVLGSSLIHTVVAISGLLLYVGLATLVDGRFLLMAVLVLVAAYYARTRHLPGTGSNTSEADSSSRPMDPPGRRILIGFVLVAAWLPFAPRSALLVAAVLAITLWVAPRIGTGAFTSLMIGTTLSIAVLSLFESPGLWGIGARAVTPSPTVSTPGRTPQPTPRSVATAPPTSTPTSADSAALAAVEASIVALQEKVERVAGPLSGSLVHPASSITSIPAKGAGVRLKDLIVQARFFNPYDRSEGVWDYGFMFREIGYNRQYRIFVDSNRNWTLQLSDMAGQTQQLRRISSGVVGSLDLSPDGSNYLRLVADGAVGYWLVNGRYVATLDLSQQTEAGSVSADTGFMRGNKIEGKQTRYEDFTVWRIPAPTETTPTAAATADVTGTTQGQLR